MRNITQKDYNNLKQLDRIEFLLERQRIRELKPVWLWRLLAEINYFVFFIAWLLLAFPLWYAVLNETQPSLLVKLVSTALLFENIYIKVLIFLGVLYIVFQILGQIRYNKIRKEAINKYLKRAKRK